MSTEVFLLKTALDMLKKALSALAKRTSAQRQKQLISTAIAELLKLHPDLNVAKANLAAAEAVGVKPNPELIFELCVAPSIVPEVGRGYMDTPVSFGTSYGEVPGPLIGGPPTRQREGSRGLPSY